MKRIRNIDLLRAAAILLIITYHCYVICEYPWSRYTILHEILCFGGEIGVTLFWMLSGFGIFCSVFAKDAQGKKPSWISFMKQRYMKLAPQYYVNVIICLVFCCPWLVNFNETRQILSYATFTQNLFMSTHGAINGALWTMGTIFQFYMIVLILYKCVNKKPIMSMIAAVVITVVNKIVIYHIIIPQFNLGDAAYFIYGRQVVSALDNFVLGMVAAKIIFILNEKNKEKNTIVNLCVCVVATILLLSVSRYFVGVGIYADNVIGYIAHSTIACLLMVILISVAMLPEYGKILEKPISFISKNQYGMYLWHLPIIRILHDESPLFKSILSRSFTTFTIGIIVLVMVFGHYSTKLIDTKQKR